MNNRTVLISGAGIAGPTLAYWLLKRGFTPTLIERAPAPRTGGYMIDFWGVGYDVADRMGLLPALHEIGYLIHEARIIDATGRRIASFDVSAFQWATHGRFISLLRSDLARHIYDLVANDVETIFDDSISGIEQDATGVTVTFERTPPRRVDLVVGADGLRSTVRALGMGERDEHELDLGYYTAAFTTDGYPHRDDDAYVSFCIPGRQIARYALRDERSAFFFVFTHPERLAIGHGGEPAQRAALRAAFSGLGWECDEILTRMETAADLYFDVMAQVRLPNWSRGRVVLLGDAAYCPSLLAGQGAAFAMTGAYVLAHALANAPGDHTTAFNTYQGSFKPFMEAKQRAAASYRWWFAPRTAAGLWLRNRAIQLLGLPGLGKLMGRSLADRFTLPD